MIYQQQPVAVVRRAGFCTRSKRLLMKTTPVGFEPTRGDPIGLAGRRLNRSAKVSLALQGRPFHLQSKFPLRIFATATTGGKRQVVTRSTKTLGAPFCKNKLQHAFQKIAERGFDPRTFGL